jgi:hypothetical protein
MGKKEYIADALNEIRFLAPIRQKNIVGFPQAFLENNETEPVYQAEYGWRSKQKIELQTSADSTSTRW